MKNLRFHLGPAITTLFTAAFLFFNLYFLNGFNFLSFLVFVVLIFPGYFKANLKGSGLYRY